MAIEFHCSSCDKKLKVKDEIAGKKIKCPSCGNPTAVPAAETAGKSRNPDLNSTESILNVNLNKFKHKEFDPEDEEENLEGLEGAVVKRRKQITGEDKPPPVPLEPIDWILGLLFTPIGLIYAIILFAKGSPQRGLKLVLLCLCMFLLAAAIIGLYVAAFFVAAQRITR